MRERERIKNRASVTHLAQSNGVYSKVIASAGLDKSVFLYDTTVRMQGRNET